MDSLDRNNKEQIKKVCMMLRMLYCLIACLSGTGHDYQLKLTIL